MRCVCGCPRSGPLKHHVVYQQHIKARAPRGLVKLSTGWVPDADGAFAECERRSLRVLLRDERNLVPISKVCHDAHHQAQPKLRMPMLPDSAFEFAEELFGPGAGFEYLRRYYAGHDERLDGMLRAA